MKGLIFKNRIMQSIKRRKNKNSIKRAFTLIELVIVVMIIGILAGLVLPQYTRAREKTVDKQAPSILSLIRSAERALYMKKGYYYPTSGTVTDINVINSNLALGLVDDGNWDYTITSNSGFNATLSRNRGGYNRNWQINAAWTNASCFNNCP